MQNNQWSYRKVSELIEGKKVYRFGSIIATVLVRGKNEDIHLRYHNTDVITFHKDGTFTLDGGGYRTATTLRRLKEFGPFQICQKNGEWLLSSDGNEIPFYDGIHVDRNGIIFKNEEFDVYSVQETVDNQIFKTI